MNNFNVKRRILLCVLFVISASCLRSATIDACGGQPIFAQGINAAWHNFGNDFGTIPLDTSYFNTMFSEIAAAHGNTLRMWIHVNGANSPVFDGSSLVSGNNTYTISNMQAMLDLAQSHGVAVIMSLWSFDMMQSQSGVVAQNSINLVTTDAGINAYINNSLIPILSAVGDHPAVLCWEICNEPEGMSNEFGWTTIGTFSMADIQKWHNRIAGAIRRNCSKPITTGAWSFQSLCNYFGGASKNYYSDAELIAAGGDTDGYFDFYQVHYYDNWGPPGTTHSPFHHPASYWGLDKPILVGEFSANGYDNNITVSPVECYNLLYDNDYAGAVSWTYTGHDGHGDLTDAAPGLTDIWNLYPDDIYWDTSCNFTPTATATLTHTPNPLWSPTVTMTPTSTPADPAKFPFEDGTLMGWSAAGNASNLVNTTSRAYAGAHSLEFDLNLPGEEWSTGEIKYAGTSPVGVIGCRIYLPAGVTQNIQAAIYIQDQAWGWNQAAWVSLTPGAWTYISYDLSVLTYTNPCQMVGIQAGGSDAYSGKIYIDSIDYLEEGEPTYTPVYSSTSTQAAPSFTYTPTVTLTGTPLITMTFTPAAILTNTFTGTQTTTGTNTFTPTHTVFQPSATPTFTPTATISSTPASVYTPSSGSASQLMPYNGGSGMYDEATVSFNGENWRVTDFSYAGYKRGEAPLRDGVPCNVVTVTGSGDITAELQSLIDSLSATGGIVRIPAGAYTISGTVGIFYDNISVEGAGSENTIINVPSSWTPDESANTYEAIFNIEPGDTGWHKGWIANGTELSQVTNVINEGDMYITGLTKLSGVNIGDWIVIQQYFWPQFVADNSNSAWSTSDRELSFTYLRQVTNKDGSGIYIDIPVFWTMDPSNNTIYIKRSGPSQDMVQNCGVSGLTINFADNNNGAGANRPIGSGIYWEGALNSWVYDVHLYNFPRFGFYSHSSARISMIECAAKKTQDYGGDGYGYGFHIGATQNVLMKRCFGEDMRHSYILQKALSNNVVMTGCESIDVRLGDDTHHGFSHAVLRDNYTMSNGNKLMGFNRGTTSGNAYETLGTGVFWNVFGDGAGGIWEGGQVDINPSDDGRAVFSGGPGYYRVYDNSTANGAYVQGDIMPLTAGLQVGVSGTQKVLYENLSETQPVAPLSLYETQLWNRLGGPPPADWDDTCGVHPALPGDTPTPDKGPGIHVYNADHAGWGVGFGSGAGPLPTVTLQPGSNLDDMGYNHTAGGNESIRMEPTAGDWGVMLNLGGPAVNTSLVTGVEMYIYIISGADLNFRWQLTDDETRAAYGTVIVDTSYVDGGSWAAGAWNRVFIPIGDFSYSGDFDGMMMRGNTNTNGRVFQMDDIKLLTGAATDTPTMTFTQSETQTYTPGETPTSTYSSTTTPTHTRTFSVTPTYTGTPEDSPTLTVTPSFSPTHSASHTPLSTNTHTFTGTPSDTPAETNTSTRTATISVTPSFTFTLTVTGTSTFTMTNTPTNTPTNTNTPVLSPTPTFTGSPPTLTDTPTITYTGTLTMTFTNMPTDTPENTATFTATFTATNTGTASITQTHIHSPTITRTPSGTPPAQTYTPTGTSTLTGSSTPTFTCTITLTMTPTFTSSLLPSATPSLTFTITISISTYTYTPTMTHTPTITLSPTAAATATQTPAPEQDEFVIEGLLAYPNPVNPVSNAELTIEFSITRSVDSVTFRLYTTASRLVRVVEMPGACAPGANCIRIDTNVFNGLGNGIYFCVLAAKDSNGNVKRSKNIAKLIILR